MNNKNKKLNWIAAATLTLGASAMVAAPAMADWRPSYTPRPDHRDSRDWRYDRYDRDRYERHDRFDRDGRYSRDIDTEIAMSEVPWRVRETLDRELGRMQRRVEKVWFVRRDGKEFYRFQVDRHHNDDLSFRISPDGRLLSVQEVNDRR